ncbi:ATP-binding protein [Shewanella loihica]|uniref:histidine kinase n=1 Tax=Shewanella loihica (strain ATCC BAA-1088 / PV-4) TaxID=323850 RepID=A3QI03_SHELP|nr:integral membrane sensor signal transduction histidine kinase [Shewanella loihica PV-4]
MISKFNLGAFTGRTAKRLILYIILFSVLITILSSALQLYVEYQDEVVQIEQQIEQVQNSHLDGIAHYLEQNNPAQLQLLIDGLVKLPDIERISIIARDRVLQRTGEVMSDRVIDTKFLLYPTKSVDAKEPLGTLHLVAGLDPLYERLKQKIWFILIATAVKTFLIAAFILLLFQYLVTRHLNKISQYAHTLTLNGHAPALTLDRMPARRGEVDELDTVVTALNEMQTRLAQELRLREEAEFDSRSSREQLAHMDRVTSMEEIASSIAHEINQPLTAIATYAQAALRTNKGDERVPEALINALEKITEQALRAGEVIRTIRQFISKQASSRSEIGVKALLTSTSHLLETLESQYKVSLVQGLADERLTVIGDLVQLQQVLFNLLRNAMEASPPDSIIEIWVEVCGDKVSLRIRDRGCGIDAEAAKEIFAPFFTTKQEGMGMGLAICKTIIDAHNGELLFSINEFGGCDFTMLLPQGEKLVAEPESQSENKPQSEQGPVS